MIKTMPRSCFLTGALLVVSVSTIFLAILPPTIAAFTIALMLICLWIAYTDLTTFRIPDIANALLFLTGVATITVVDHSLLLQHVLASACTFGFFWLIGEALFRRFDTDMLGMGDAKLIGAGTMWVGPFGFPSAVLIAALTGLLFAIVAGRTRKAIPFGPFLCLGIIAVWLYGPLVV